NYELPFLPSTWSSLSRAMLVKRLFGSAAFWGVSVLVAGSLVFGGSYYLGSESVTAEVPNSSDLVKGNEDENSTNSNANNTNSAILEPNQTTEAEKSLSLDGEKIAEVTDPLNQNLVSSEINQGPKQTEDKPNPDVLCNREIKFDVFLKAAIQLKADFVATGHYCQKEEFTAGESKEYRLLQGKDSAKDQSYFLCQLNQTQLSQALFPIGHLLKSEVRVLAEQFNLPNATKKDSQGLCFVGKVKLPVFLQQQLNPKPGKVLKLNDNVEWNKSDSLVPENKTTCKAFVFKTSDGECIGEHTGAHFYTVGQRKGLGIGGQAIPLFVAGIDTSENVVFVVPGEKHSALARNGLLISKSDLHWVRESALNGKNQIQVMCRIRYRQP
ncbi:MAG: MnmA/TRMU family protein, partial [Bacteroidota bacterium]